MPMIVKKEKFFKKVLTFGKVCCIIIFVAERAIRNADVAHLVERNLAKVEVAGSSPVIRSKELNALLSSFFIRRHSQVVRHESAKLRFPSSNLGVASIYKGLVFYIL